MVGEKHQRSRPGCGMAIGRMEGRECQTGSRTCRFRAHLSMSATATSSRSLFLLDESSSIQDFLRVTLEAEGYRVLVLADGSEGVRLYREHPGVDHP